MKKYGQRKLPELWTAQTLRCSKVQRQLHHVHMPWLCQLVGSLLGSATGDVKGTVDRRKKGQTLSYFSQLLQSSSSLQWQLVPAAPTDSSLQFSQHFQKTPSTHPLRVTRTINWQPLLEGLGPRSTEFPSHPSSAQRRSESLFQWVHPPNVWVLTFQFHTCVQRFYLCGVVKTSM